MSSFLRVYQKRPFARKVSYGGPKETRTPDLFHAMEARYQLCYGPKLFTTSLFLHDLHQKINSPAWYFC